MHCARLASLARRGPKNIKQFALLLSKPEKTFQPSASFQALRQQSTFSNAMNSAEPTVIYKQGASLGLVTLNRPRVLNSLDQSMLDLLEEILERSEHSDNTHGLLVKGAGGKAYCAGGDVKQMVLDIMAGLQEKGRKFFKQEYGLNYKIASLQKPYIALIDGITMGGGCGVSIHGSFRVATEKTVFAMPECAIGFFCDVGASYFLSRLPGRLGLYLALGGIRLKGAEVRDAQLATHYVPSQLLPELEAALDGLGPAARDWRAVNEVLRSFEARNPIPASSLWSQMPAINECFTKDSVEEIYAALEQRGDAWAKETLAAMAKGSPLSQRVVFRELREASALGLADCLRQEVRLVTHMVRGPSDFVEGVRALLIDKDGKPNWIAPTLAQVTDEMVDRFFQPLAPEEELQLPTQSRL